MRTGGKTAVISARGTFIQGPFFVDLTTKPPTLTGSLDLNFGDSDIDITCTPNGFALILGKSSFNTSDLTSIDIAQQTVRSIVPFPSIHDAVGVTPDGAHAVVATNFNNGMASLIAIAPDGTLTDAGNSASNLKFQLLNITIASNGRFAFLARFSPDNQTSSLSALDLPSFNLRSTSSGRSTVQSVAFSPMEDRAYAYFNVIGEVRVFNIDSNDIVTNSGIRIFVGPGSSSGGVDKIAVTANGEYVLVRSTDNVFGDISILGK